MVKRVLDITASFSLNKHFNKIKTMNQTKEKIWKDENGTGIPSSRITKAEKLNERKLAKIIGNAQSLHKKIEQFKRDLVKDFDDMELARYEELGVIPEGSTGLSLFNFDRTMKIEKSISKPIQFDDQTIEAAKIVLQEIFRTTVETKYEYIRSMLTDAFQTTNGKLDPRKVLNILRYEKQANNPLYTKLCDLIKKAIRRPNSKTYYKLFIKDEEGKYNSIELNFSNI